MASWQSTAHLQIDEITDWLFAADATAATDLERNLRAFAAEDSEHVVLLQFADKSGRCGADRQPSDVRRALGPALNQRNLGSLLIRVLALCESHRRASVSSSRVALPQAASVDVSSTNPAG